MFLRAKTRKKDGKIHRYFSAVENQCVGIKRRTVQLKKSLTQSGLD